MRDFLTRLSARTLGSEPVAQPRTQPLFDFSPSAVANPPVEEIVGPRTQPAPDAASSRAPVRPSEPIERLVAAKDRDGPAMSRAPRARPTNTRHAAAPTANPPQSASVPVPLVANPVRRTAEAQKGEQPIANTLMHPDSPIGADTVNSGARLTATSPVSEFKDDPRRGGDLAVRAVIPPVTRSNADPIERETRAPLLKPAPPVHSRHRMREGQDGEARTRGGTDRSTEAPTIRVTIGRVEVRAVAPAIPASPTQRAPRHSAMISLDNYLKRRGPE